MNRKTFLKQFILIFIVFTVTAAISFGQICGDIDGNGTPNIVDALLVSQCYVGLITCPSADIGDVDCSGAINIVDALLISQYYVGLISALNCCGTDTETPTPPPTETPTQPAVDTPTPDPGIETHPMKVYYKNMRTNSESREIECHFLLENASYMPLPLSKFEIHYFCTWDNTPIENLTISRVQTDHMSGSAIVTLHDTHTDVPNTGYIRIAFSSDSSDIIDGTDDAKLVGIQVQIQIPSGAYFDQSNDISWDPSYTDYAEYLGVRIYQDGIPVWGEGIDTPTPTPSPTPWPTTDPGTPSPVPTATPDWPAMVGMFLEAEAFDRALDMDATNQGKRVCIGCANPNAGVDFEDNWEGGLNTGWVSGGEWLEWDVQISRAGTYNIWVRAAHDDTGTMSANILVNGSLAGSVSVPNTDTYGVAHPPGHWQNWENFKAGSAALNSGINTIRLEYPGSTGSFNLDYVYLTDQNNTPPEKTPVPDPPGYVRPIDKYGQLYMLGNTLVDYTGAPVQLKGFSSHDFRWHWLAKRHTIQNIAFGLGVDLFRLAMYVDPGNYGYIASGHRDVILERLHAYMDDAINSGIYIIVDWHVLVDQNPQKYQSEAVSFFTMMSERYGDYPGVIWELCNEPNGSTTWAQIKSYAQAVIPRIRANDPDNIIVVGTPEWSQHVDVASLDPITIEGSHHLLYGYHFYAGTHGQTLRDRGDTAIKNGIGLFVTEWGTVSSSGTGAPDISASTTWLNWMAENNISWANWSFCNKAEGASVLQEHVNLSGPWSTGDLTQTGQWVLSQM